MRLSYAIQTHPARADLACELACQIPGSELVVDPDPSGPPSPWRTYRAALELTPPRATHRVIIQDDAELCRNFTKAVRRVAAVRPDNLVSLFVGGAPREGAQALWAACAADERFCVLPRERWVPAIALVWPTRLIASFLAYVDEQRWPAIFRADDEIIGRGMTGLRETVLATVPSLVEHPDDQVSIVGRKNPLYGLNPDRVAVCFIDGDPLELVWR